MGRGRRERGRSRAAVLAVVAAAVLVPAASWPAIAEAAPARPATTAAPATPAAPAQDAAAEPIEPGVAVQGVEALDASPQLVDQVAATNDLSATEAEDLLADPTAWAHPTGHVYFADPVDEHATTDAPDAEPSAATALAKTFQLHSRPGSKRTIYLDFDGHTASGTYWSSTDLVAEPYDTDGSPTFSASELDDIQQVWQRVAEDYAALDVDVTTQDPGVAAIRRDTAADDTYGTRAVISDIDASKVTPISPAGVAYFDAFDEIGTRHDALQPAWVFSNGLSDEPKWIGEAVSHEVGHNLGLQHDGGAGDGEYYRGHDLWAPIMGAAYSHPVTQFSKGEYGSSSNKEDDFAVMASHGALAATDDHTDATATATTLTSIATGTLSTAADKDLFKYVATATGTWNFQAEPLSSATNVDLKLTLLSSTGTQLATADPQAVEVDEATATGLDASISYAVTSGSTYYLRVQPTSVLTPSTGYSTYGTVGGYTISASNQPACATQDANEPDSTFRTARLAISGQAASARICRGDVDYATIVAKAGQQIDANLAFTNASGDLDLTLYGPSGSVVAASATTGNGESIAHVATESGVYVAEIIGKTATVTNSYTLTLTSPLCPTDDGFENNDTLGTAKVLQVGVTYDAVACVGDADFYSAPVTTGAGYLVEVSSASRYGPLQIDDYGPTGTIIDTRGGDYEWDDLQIYGYAEGRSTARVRVKAAGTTPNLYTIRFTRPPDAPTGVGATPGYQAATVTWTPPVNDGGAPVTGYWVEVSRNGTIVAADTATAPPLTIGGLTNGQAHTVRVYATNRAGNGALSASVNVTPSSTVTAPSVPRSLTVSPSFDGKLYASWTEPATDGGSAITGYVLTPYVGGVAKPTLQFAAGATSAEVTGLTRGTAYTFKLAAKNATGTGPQTAATASVTMPATVPGAPTGVSAAPGNQFAVVSWTAPADDGGSPIVGYTITAYVGGAELFFLDYDDTDTTHAFGGLDNGTAYTFKVAARNAEGTGAQSTASNAVTPTGAGVPGAPTGATATAGNAQATVSWTAPTSNGGSAITGYVVTPYVGAVAQTSRTFASTATSQVVTGLTNGTTYTFKVAAKNIVGTGGQSAASNAVTPQVPPPSGALYVPITPCRIFDTRVTGAGGRLSGSRSILVTGTTGFEAQGGKAGGCGIPAGTVAVEASITAVAPAAAGRLRVSPVGGTTPTYGFLEWTAGQSITNTGLVNLATSGSPQLVLANETGSTHIVVDVQGYFAPKATAPASAAKYVAMTPCRIVDTRVAGGAFTDQATRSYAVRGGGTAFAAQGGKSGGCAIPSGATAIEASVTAVGPSSAGYARAWPTGATPPTATFLNFEAGRSLTNTGTFSLASTASAKPLTLRSYGTKTQYVIDVQGYFLPQSSAPSSAAVYVPLGGCDLVDTRVAGGTLAADAIRSYVVKGTGTAFADQGVTGGRVLDPVDRGRDRGDADRPQPGGLQLRPGLARRRGDPHGDLPQLAGRTRHRQHRHDRHRRHGLAPAGPAELRHRDPLHAVGPGLLPAPSLTPGTCPGGHVPDALLLVGAHHAGTGDTWGLAMAMITWHWTPRATRGRRATAASGSVREVAEPWMPADVRAAYPPERPRSIARPAPAQLTPARSAAAAASVRVATPSLR